MRNTKHFAVLLVCLISSGILSGCGGGDDAPTPTANVWDDGSGSGNVLVWDDGSNSDNMKWEN